MPVLLAQAGTAPSGNLVCKVFPFLQNIKFDYIQQLCGTGQEITSQTAVQQGVLLVQTLVSLIFVGIIIIAVYVIIKAAIKYIRSEGNDEKIQEAQKAIKSVFIGLVALFVGIIGLVLILVIFNALGAVNSATVNDTGDIVRPT